MDQLLLFYENYENVKSIRQFHVERRRLHGYWSNYIRNLDMIAKNLWRASPTRGLIHRLATHLDYPKYLIVFFLWNKTTENEMINWEIENSWAVRLAPKIYRYRYRYGWVIFEGCAASREHGRSIPTISRSWSSSGTAGPWYRFQYHSPVQTSPRRRRRRHLHQHFPSFPSGCRLSEYHPTKVNSDFWTIWWTGDAV